MAVLKVKINGEWVAVGTAAKGDKGDSGQNGLDGITPVKGVDYFTSADKQEMVSAVLASLPLYDGSVTVE